MKRVAMIVFWIAVTLCGLALVWAFRLAAVLFLISTGVAAAIRPMVDRLLARGVSRNGSIAIAYSVCLAVVGTLAYVLAARLVVELPAAVDRLMGAYAHAAQTWPHAGGIRELVSGLMPPPGELGRAVPAIEPVSVAGTAVGTTLAVLDAIGSVLLVLVLSIYWSCGRDGFERLWLSFLPARRRTPARAIWVATRRNVGAHLRRELGLSVIAGVVLIIGLRVLGCEFWAVATVSVLILRLIPLLGGPLAVLAAGLAASASGAVPGVLATALTLALLAVLRFVVAPRAFQVENPLDPILAVLVILALAGQFGIVGLVAAPFVAVAVQTIFGEAVALRAGDAGDIPTLAELAERANQLERKFERAPTPPAVASLLSRLQLLLDRAAAR